MYRSILSISFLFFISINCIFAQFSSEDVLSKIDALVSYPDNDYSAEYTITQERPGQGTEITKAIIFRRDVDDKYLILIIEPLVDKGKGYLKIGNNLWLYDPVDRRFTVTSAKDRFQNSNARNSDFTQSTLAKDYTIVGKESEKLGVYSTSVLQLEAKNDDVTYPKMKIWVDENNLVRKVEDYSLSGQLMRTTAIPRYKAIDNYYIPIQIVFVDALAGATVNGKFRNERTIITVAKPSLTDLPDMVFTQAYLERVSQ